MHTKDYVYQATLVIAISLVSCKANQSKNERAPKRKESSKEEPDYQIPKKVDKEESLQLDDLLGVWESNCISHVNSNTSYKIRYAFSKEAVEYTHFGYMFSKNCQDLDRQTVNNWTDVKLSNEYFKVDNPNFHEMHYIYQESRSRVTSEIAQKHANTGSYYGIDNWEINKFYDILGKKSSEDTTLVFNKGDKGVDTFIYKDGELIKDFGRASDNEPVYDPEIMIMKKK